MLKMALAYVATGLAFVALDGGWLALVGPRLYRPVIGALLADKVRAGPAILFYLIYVSGLVYFAVRPGLARGVGRAALSGAVLGLVAYSAYDLTCQAVMKTWSSTISIADIGWGVIASAAAAAGGAAVTRALVPKLGG